LNWIVASHFEVGWKFSWLSPNSIMPTFTESSLRGKSRTQTLISHEIMKFRWKSPTQITKVADTNHLDVSRCLRQSLWQVRNKPICVAVMEFSQLQCTGKVCDKFPRTLSQSWRNGIRILLGYRLS